jgi:nucleoside-diphosphate-sugar epimerase
VARAGAEVHRGDLEDLKSLRSGAAKSDAVIHTAFVHDFSKFLENCEIDRKAIEAMGDVLVGSDRPLIITSGTGMGNAAPGEPASEEIFNTNHTNPRKVSEIAGAEVGERGVNVSVVRLPQVHDPVKQGLITYAVHLAREKGISAYVGDGRNRWPAVHLLDAARLYRLAVEKGKAGRRYNAVAEEGVQVREIAEVIGQGLKVAVVSLSPAEVPAHFGWLAEFVGYDMPASSALTQAWLGWKPTGPGLMADLKKMRYA